MDANRIGRVFEGRVLHHALQAPAHDRRHDDQNRQDQQHFDERESTAEHNK